MTGQIRLVVTDIDGTLVRTDKTLHPATVAAAQALRQAGVALALVSSRPPDAVAEYVDALGIDTPRAGFNGGLILDPSGRTLHERTIPPDAAARAIATLDEAQGVQAWAFSGEAWFRREADGPYVALERRVLGKPGEVVPDLGPHLGRLHKIMAACPDFSVIARLESELAEILSGQAAVHRSQDYYLDVTHPEADKGHAVTALAGLLGVPLDAVCVLGDMPNDVPMFSVAGMSVAMGQASEGVRARATHVTGDNDGPGWSEAIRRWVLHSG